MTRKYARSRKPIEVQKTTETAMAKINESEEIEREMPEQKFATEKGNSVVEAIRGFTDEIPKDGVRGLLAPPLTKEEQEAKARFERMRVLLKVCELRLSTFALYGAANPYIEEISGTDDSISRAIKVVIATQAVRDLLNVHDDLEILRIEARRLYKEMGIEMQPDKLNQTLDALADLVRKGINKTDLAKEVV